MGGSSVITYGVALDAEQLLVVNEIALVVPEPPQVKQPSEPEQMTSLVRLTQELGTQAALLGGLHGPLRFGRACQRRRRLQGLRRCLGTR